MKRRILTLSLLGALCAVGFTSCDKIKDKLFPAFEVDVSDVAVTIPITVAGVEANSSGNVAFNLDSAIKAHTENAFGINSLSSVKVKDITVTLVDADDLNNISNFETVAVKLATNTVSTPAVVASAAIPNTPATYINIPADANTPELKDYLKGNQLTYTVSSMARKSTTAPLHAIVSLTLSVK